MSEPKATAEHVAAILLALPLVVMSNAIAVVLFWRWFVAPLGVPEIHFGHALGLWFFAGLLRGTRPKDHIAEKEWLANPWQKALIYPAGTMLTVGIGWAIHTWGMS